MTANAPAFAGAHLHFFWFQLSFASHPKSVRLERRREAHKAGSTDGCLVFARHERNYVVPHAFEAIFIAVAKSSRPS